MYISDSCLINRVVLNTIDNLEEKASSYNKVGKFLVEHVLTRVIAAVVTPIFTALLCTYHMSMALLTFSAKHLEKANGYFRATFSSAVLGLIDASLLRKQLFQPISILHAKWHKARKLALAQVRHKKERLDTLCNGLKKLLLAKVKQNRLDKKARVAYLWASAKRLGIDKVRQDRLDKKKARLAYLWNRAKDFAVCEVKQERRKIKVARFAKRHQVSKENLERAETLLRQANWKKDQPEASGGITHVYLPIDQPGIVIKCSGDRSKKREKQMLRFRRICTYRNFTHLTVPKSSTTKDGNWLIEERLPIDTTFLSQLDLYLSHQEEFTGSIIELTKFAYYSGLGDLSAFETVFDHSRPRTDNVPLYIEKNDEGKNSFKIGLVDLESTCEDRNEAAKIFLKSSLSHLITCFPMHSKQILKTASELTGKELKVLTAEHEKTRIEGLNSANFFHTNLCSTLAKRQGGIELIKPVDQNFIRACLKEFKSKSQSYIRVCLEMHNSRLIKEELDRLNLDRLNQEELDSLYEKFIKEVSDFCVDALNRKLLAPESEESFRKRLERNFFLKNSVKYYGLVCIAMYWKRNMLTQVIH